MTKNKRFIRNNPKNLMDITENLPYNKDSKNV